LIVLLVRTAVEALQQVVELSCEFHLHLILLSLFEGFRRLHDEKLTGLVSSLGGYWHSCTLAASFLIHRVYSRQVLPGIKHAYLMPLILRSFCVSTHCTVSSFACSVMFFVFLVTLTLMTT